MPHVTVLLHQLLVLHLQLERAGLAYYSDVNAVPTGPPSAGTVENEQRTWQKGGAMGELGPDGRERRPPVLPPVKASSPTQGGQDLERRAEALKKLKKRIDGVIAELDTSPAAKHKVSSRRVTRKSLSGESIHYVEADDLFAKCGEVHETLTLLSSTLRDQIDATGIAIKGCDQGFDALDEEEKRRFWRIQARVQAAEKKLKHPDGEGGRGEREQEKDAGAPTEDQHRGDSGGTEW